MPLGGGLAVSVQQGALGHLHRGACCLQQLGLGVCVSEAVVALEVQPSSHLGNGADDGEHGRCLLGMTSLTVVIAQSGSKDHEKEGDM